MRNQEFNRLCDNIGLVRMCFPEEIWKYTIHHSAVNYNSDWGYRIANFNEYDEIDYGAWLLPCEDESIKERLYKLGESIKKFKSRRKLEKMEEDF